MKHTDENEDVVWVVAGDNGPVILPSSLGRVYDPKGTPIDRIADQHVAVKVPNSRFIRRRIEVGDLVLADSPGGKE